ncbi:F-box domain-containing protein [Mycena sanguinolenta]|uniref:F-box domain-containing protein n=1 Tax=Mycena sanguinolenta TaxID=230812 RepID=A0A8H6YG44_9AGAR|nr:F-box domain-containing protein [Mycena sanguinolenta]
MAVHLPDEIISEILSPALKVSDEAFSDTSLESPFAGRYCESSSAFLLVCKAWLRVATPLLYHVVVLRSKAQATALELALRQNPELGRFILKLRVEGGYGASMLKIIKAAPNVKEMFVSINIWSADNVSGLVRGLPTMDLTRVIMYDTPHHNVRNKNSQAVLDALKQCIEQEWKKLVVCELPYSSNYASFRSSRTLIAIATSLSVAPALKVVRIPTMRIYGPTPPEHLSLIAKNPRLQSIEFTVRSNPKLANAWTSTSPAFSHPSLRGLVKVPEIPEPSPSRSPTPRPSSSNPQLQYSTESVPEEIWNRILRFAMARDPENQETHSHRLWLVSKKFARLALPYLRESLLIRTPFHYDDFIGKLSSDPSLRSQVRTLYFDTAAALSLRPVFGVHLVNIIGLSPVNVTLKVFSDLAKYRGSTLVRLEGVNVTKSSNTGDAAIFSKFTNIRSLSVGFKASFTSSTSVPSGALDTLEQLNLTNFDPSLMAIFCQMDLPAIRHASFPSENAGLGPFLTKHGAKLQTLTIVLGTHRLLRLFDACPAVVDLTVICASLIPNASFYSSSSSLETITFTTDGKVRGAERKWAPFFDALHIDTFPRSSKDHRSLH